MNASKEDPTIEMDEYRVQRAENGAVSYHPLRELYVWSHNAPGFNNHDLIVVGNELFKSNVFMDVVLMDVRFYGEPVEERDREAWADPLRAKILRRLMTEDQSWYIGFVVDFTELILCGNIDALPAEMAIYFSEKSSSQVFILDAEDPYGHYLHGTHKKLFLEVKAEEMDWVVSHIWPESYPGSPIEGYLLPSDKGELLKKWAAGDKNEALFRKVLDAARCMFTTFSEERRHFRFITNKMDAGEFARTVQFEELVRLARQLPV